MPDNLDKLGFAGQTQRANVGYCAKEGIAVSTTAVTFWMIDTANMGGVNCSLTVYNSGSTTIRLRGYVCNDNLLIPSNGGRITLSGVYDETDSTVSLPLSITAGSTDHIVFGYKQQPQYTTFRWWIWTLDTASGTSTASAFGNVK